MPRPTKFSDVTANAILTALRAGCIEADAAGAAGVDYATMRRWKVANAQFCASVDTAKYQAKVRAVEAITRAVQAGSWKAALEWLERRYPAEWGKRTHLDVTIRQEAERIASDFGLPIEEVQEEVERILAARL